MADTGIILLIIIVCFIFIGAFVFSDFIAKELGISAILVFFIGIFLPPIWLILFIYCFIKYLGKHHSHHHHHHHHLFGIL